MAPVFRFGLQHGEVLLVVVRKWEYKASGADPWSGWCCLFSLTQDQNMAEATTKVPVPTEKRSAGPASALQAWQPIESLRREVDRLFEDFDRGFWRSPFRSTFALEPLWRGELTWGAAPAVDITESDKAYEVTADLPGMSEKDVEVRLANGGLVIKGQKQEEKEEKKKDYYLHERRFGSFERSFRVPEGVETDKVEASFKNGVLTVTLPKTAEAQKAQKKIAVKAS
jgi:HSP20 family protein